MAIPIFIPLFWQVLKVVYLEDGKIFVWNANNLGDMPYHIGLASYLQHSKFWPSNYIFPLESLKYPFAVDYLHTLLQNFISYLWVYPLLSFLGLFLSAFIALQMGGVGFLYLLFCNASWSLLSQDQLSWKNFLLAVFIPQRGYILALPIGLLLTDRLWKYMQDKLNFTTKDIIFYGILLGSLAWIHLHSFVFFLGFSVLVSLYRCQKNTVYYLIVAGILGAPFLLQSTDYLQKASSLQFLFIWDKSGGQNTANYLFQNLGFLLLLPICLPWIKKRSIQTWLLFASAMFAFFLVCILSVWPWDNIKILLWAYVAFIFGFYQTITNKILRFLFVMLFSLPGLYAIWTYTFQDNKKQVIFSIDEVERYKDWFDESKKKETYIALPTYNHPIFYYGASAVMGYDGHLWSHGVKYTKLKDELSTLPRMSAEELLAFSVRNKAKYLIYSSLERSGWGQILALDSFEKVYTNKDLVIYRMY
ncbi:MAG: hypothetical protein KDD37_10350 [Bdellovibrionales bacterium]|nr:hypothetical protein [Bdellovibrionales bacterium]